MPTIRRSVALLSAVCVLGTSLPLPAFAAAPSSLVTTEEIVRDTPIQQRVTELLARDDVRAALVERGVDPAQVQARVDALTADEAQQLAERLDQLPAGGDVLGVLFAVFLILLITDILGLTKIFPFTRPVR
jgi:hypothetical protein